MLNKYYIGEFAVRRAARGAARAVALRAAAFACVCFALRRRPWAEQAWRRPAAGTLRIKQPCQPKLCMVQWAAKRQPTVARTPAAAAAVASNCLARARGQLSGWQGQALPRSHAAAPAVAWEIILNLCQTPCFSHTITTTISSGRRLGARDRQGDRERRLEQRRRHPVRPAAAAAAHRRGGHLPALLQGQVKRLGLGR